MMAKTWHILLPICLWIPGYVQQIRIPSRGLYSRDIDIQDSIVGITIDLGRTCPVVIIFDQILPHQALNRMLYRFPNQSPFPLTFIFLDLSASNIDKLHTLYGFVEPAEIFLKFLHALYRMSKCYTIIIWVSDPLLLESHSAVTTHPGWRQSDIVILPVHHLAKRYKFVISLQFWADIPNIIALKRKLDGSRPTNEVRVFTVIPYYGKNLRKSQELDVWLVKENEFYYGRDLFFDKFDNFNLSPLKFGMFWKEPFLIWGTSELPFLDGLDWRLLLICQKNLNFTPVFENVLSFGRQHRFGEGANATLSWTGMMGMLRNNRLDIGIGGVYMYSERMEAFGFTKPYYTDSLSFISPISKLITTQWNSFIKPFHVDCCRIEFFTAAVTLKIVADINLRVCGGTTNHFNSGKNVFGFIITLICQKPYRFTPKSLPVQFVFYGIIMCNFVLGILFASCLMAYLFQFKQKPLADTVPDIVKSKLQVNTRDYDGFLQELMEYSRDPIIQAINKRSSLVEWNSTAEDDVVRGKTILIDSLARFKFAGKYRYMGAKGLKFHIGSDNVVDHANIGWPVRKNWPFTKKFDDVINRAVENGFVQFWMKRFMQGQFGWDHEAWRIPELSEYLEEKEHRVHDVDPSLVLDQQFVPLSTSHLYGVISLYIVGMFLAIVSFAAELILSCTYYTGKHVYGSCCLPSKTKSLTKQVKVHNENRSQQKLSIPKNLQKEKGQEVAKPLSKVISGHKSTHFTIKNRPPLYEDKNSIKIKKGLPISPYSEMIWTDFDNCERFAKTIQPNLKVG